MTLLQKVRTDQPSEINSRFRSDVFVYTDFFVAGYLAMFVTHESGPLWPREVLNESSVSEGMDPDGGVGFLLHRNARVF